MRKLKLKRPRPNQVIGLVVMLLGLVARSASLDYTRPLLGTRLHYAVGNYPLLIVGIVLILTGVAIMIGAEVLTMMLPDSWQARLRRTPKPSHASKRWYTEQSLLILQRDWQLDEVQLTRLRGELAKNRHRTAFDSYIITPEGKKLMLTRWEDGSLVLGHTGTVPKTLQHAVHMTNSAIGGLKSPQETAEAG
jgi:hypothetical protein